MMKKDIEFWYGYLCVLAIAAAYFLAMIIRKNHCTASATGTIWRVETVDHPPSAGGSQYTLYISFTADGVEMETQKHISVNKGPFQRGDQVTIMYDPQKPKHCYVDGYALSTIFF